MPLWLWSLQIFKILFSKSLFEQITCLQTAFIVASLCFQSFVAHRKKSRSFAVGGTGASWVCHPLPHFQQLHDHPTDSDAITFNLQPQAFQTLIFYLWNNFQGLRHRNLRKAKSCPNIASFRPLIHHGVKCVSELYLPTPTSCFQRPSFRHGWNNHRFYRCSSQALAYVRVQNPVLYALFLWPLCSIGKELGVDPEVILQTSHGRRSIDVLRLISPEKANWECTSILLLPPTLSCQTG